MRDEAEPQAEGELSLFIADILSFKSVRKVCILHKGDRLKYMYAEFADRVIGYVESYLACKKDSLIRVYNIRCFFIEADFFFLKERVSPFSCEILT